MKYVRKIVDDYCVLDLETTGLSTEYCEIIEIGILKIRQNKIVDQYQQLIKPEDEVDDFITELTGITNEMLENQPSILDVKEEVLKFIGNDLIIGHNTSFDKNFIESKFGSIVSNEYIDTMQFSRKLFPEMKHHRLKDMVKKLGLSNNMHRSISDCIATKELYDVIKNTMDEKKLKINDLFIRNKKHIYKPLDFTKIVPTNDQIDEDNFFYQKHCVFTGTLEKMIRKDAAQLVVNVGGILDKSVTKETNYLILGNNDFCKSIKDGKSTKQKKAEELKLKGNDIDILDENTFYKLIGIETIESNHNINKCENNDSKNTDIKNLVFNFIKSMRINDEKLSECNLFESSTRKWFSIKVDNKTLLKIFYPSSQQDYIVEFKNFYKETKNPENAIFEHSDEIHEIYKEISSTANDEIFGCCSHYEECSNEMKCVKDNDFSRNCYYRKNLENGKIFYGKNRNV